ncbi:leucine--tRNA ligase [soil metagenome]
MEYNFRETEKKWQQYWAEHKTFAAKNDASKKKFYVLDMFPYPSGAGLHVGHPLGYIASDIYARYKRLKGFNVLHPMGFDAFGLPAEQYAIQTGQHPAITTEQNISRYREQLDNLGLSFDWDREVRTSDPSYYKWTQWIFLKLFNSWYNEETGKTEPLSSLEEKFKNHKLKVKSETADKNWNDLNEQERSDVLMEYRLAYLSEAFVNWCPALGTVLANDEVKDGVSERGGYPVEKKKMKQWSMRITAFADRLLNDLEGIDWSESIKEQQRNWIGKSEGTEIKFTIHDSQFTIHIFTTRPDTIFGVSYMTLAPEHELVEKITTDEQRVAVQNYILETKNRSDRERMAEVKRISGVFTGAYAIHPFTGNQIPVWVGDYVLAGYGTGAVMAVPAHDSRDYAFATHFNLPKPQVIQPKTEWDFSAASYDEKEGTCINSDFLNGLHVKDAIKKAIDEIENRGFGTRQINYRLRDAAFGRQRYWGEPIPIYYENGIPKAVDEKDLPVILPEVDKYLPTEDGEPPLARAKNWKYKNTYDYETTTMPGWAGSSWYYLRYMDAHNEKEFASKDALEYWHDVDLYIGGSEHATGHLLYVRFWTKALYDLGLIPVFEPAKKLINQGMIQGVSEKIRRQNFEKDLSKGATKANTITFSNPLKQVRFETAKIIYVSADTEDYDWSKEYYTEINVPIESVKNSELDPQKFFDNKNNTEAILMCQGGYWMHGKYFSIQEGSDKFLTKPEVEKMSKSKWNVVSPDDMIEKYGADCLRLYEMFLGPLELSKPWNTNGISGTSNFIRKLWRLYHKDFKFTVSDDVPTKKELKSIHKLIKKVTDDIERFSFNTSVSNFMICVNELTDLKCDKRVILDTLAILVSPYAPHVAEELWNLLGHEESVTFAGWPEFKEEFLAEDSFAYPISINGKTKLNLEISLSLNKDEIEKEVMSSEEVKKFFHGQSPKKVIVVPGRIVNIVM